MPTLHLILDEEDLVVKLPKMRGVHYVKMHLENFRFSDQEVNDYAQAAAMMLLSAVQGSESAKHNETLAEHDEGVNGK